MFNFLDYKLKPHVNADCPATDGYEVENLLSSNISQKNKGFLAYTAIRPPVNIDFEFICPINLYFILIWTSLDSQKSSGIEFYVKNSTSNYCSISKVFTEDEGIILYNRKYFSLLRNREIPENFIQRFCQTNQQKNLSNIEKLRIKIFRTKSSIPCIKKIEVWGDISRICSDVTRNNIKQLVENDKHSNQEKNNLSSLDLDNTKKEYSFNIPEEFIDPISCELMSLPITLPSGKTIDQITLEKFQESEAKWGRSPSDPFTGQLFNAVRKPVLNTALKSRIDEFLIKNSHEKETFHLQRTLGTKKKNNLIQSSTSKKEIDNNKTVDNVQPSTSSNLDDLINSAMKQYNIVRFTLNNIESDKKPLECCGICDNAINLYLLQCKHFICRLCLLRTTESRCKICNSIICKKTATKYHNL